VDAEPYQGGVIVRFLTKSAWFIGDVALDGDISGPPTAGQLENAARLDLGQPFTALKVQQAVEGQRPAREHGLYRSSIQPSLQEDNNYQQVNIRFNVDSGPRARFGAPISSATLKLDPGPYPQSYEVPPLDHQHVEAGHPRPRAAGPGGRPPALTRKRIACRPRCLSKPCNMTRRTTW